MGKSIRHKWVKSEIDFHGSMLQVLELSKIEVDQKEEIARLSGLNEESQEQIENLEFMVLEAQHTAADTEKVGRWL